MILFFDTETTGKPKKYNAKVTDVDNWPRVVQLAWIACQEDGTHAGNGMWIIKPDGWTIPDEAAAVHGITQAEAELEGVPMNLVYPSFWRIVKASDLIVGHNIEFDVNVMGAEFIRYTGFNPFDGVPTACTMKSGTDFCKLPKTVSFGSDKYKWPKLHELYYALFGREMGKAHEAFQDIKNTTECYFEMKSRGIIK